MGGCVASKLGGGEQEVVGICRERKRLMKLAVDRRYALADAHCRYSHSLFAVSAAIKLFVARHSTPSSPFLITFPPPNCHPPSTDPLFLDQEKPSSQTTPPPCCAAAADDSDDSEDDDGDDQTLAAQVEENVRQNQETTASSCGYLYMAGGGLPPPPFPYPQGDFGWDFFNPFYGVRSELHEDYRVVREEEGIPELEEEEKEEEIDRGGKEEEQRRDTCHVVVPAQPQPQAQAAAKAEADDKGLAIPSGGRDLFHALNDIEDHFIRAYDSAKNVSRMLEANKPHLTSGLDDIKENSTKLIQAITLQSSNTARSSSCKSLVASASINHNSSSWIEYKNQLFGESAGMAAGSHSLTLGRLYAWEKKLYDEVKAGDNLRKLYEKKCSQLRTKNVRGVDTLSLDKSRAGAKDLYSRILVAIRRAESISEKIQKLTSEELEPQIIELLHGLAESWRMMLESHQTQNMIIYEAKFYECPTYGKFSSESHRLATLQLEAEIQNWKECFHDYVAAQRSYVEALHGWLSKFIVPEVEFCSKGRTLALPFCSSGPPLYTVCHDWLSSMESLPCKMVSVAMTTFVKDLKALWVQQGEEQDQKRKVDKLAKELDKKILAYQKAESRIHEPKLLLEYNKDQDFHKEEDVQSHHHHQVDELMEKKETLESCKRRLDMEKERHNKCMQETQRITLNGFQTGFSSIFETLVQFANTSLKMYDNLAIVSQSVDNKEDGDPSSLQDSQGNGGS
ncbi:hypothetical protein V2J09_016361 [Rumex salicifolius]